MKRGQSLGGQAIFEMPSLTGGAEKEGEDGDKVPCAVGGRLGSQAQSRAGALRRRAVQKGKKGNEIGRRYFPNNRKKEEKGSAKQQGSSARRCDWFAAGVLLEGPNPCQFRSGKKGHGSIPS